MIVTTVVPCTAITNIVATRLARSAERMIGKCSGLLNSVARVPGSVGLEFAIDALPEWKPRDGQFSQGR